MFVKRFNFSWIVVAAASLAPAVGFAQQVSCVRGGLQRAVNLYVEAQTKGDTAGLAARQRARLRREHGAHRHRAGPHQHAAEDRPSPQLARRGDVPDVHRADRHGCREAVRPRHAHARQPRQDRRDRDRVDDDGLLAVQRRELPEVLVGGRLGPDSRPRSATRARRSSARPTRISTRSSKARSTRCRGASRACASKAACTPARTRRPIAARSACRAA